MAWVLWSALHMILGAYVQNGLLPRSQVRWVQIAHLQSTMQGLAICETRQRATPTYLAQPPLTVRKNDRESLHDFVIEEVR